MAAKGITLKNGKAARIAKSALVQHDRTMHGGKPAPKITIKNSGGNGKNTKNGNRNRNHSRGY